MVAIYCEYVFHPQLASIFICQATDCLAICIDTEAEPDWLDFSVYPCGCLGRFISILALGLDKVAPQLHRRSPVTGASSWANTFACINSLSGEAFVAAFIDGSHAATDDIRPAWCVIRGRESQTDVFFSIVVLDHPAGSGLFWWMVLRALGMEKLGADRILLASIDCPVNSQYSPSILSFFVKNHPFYGWIE